MTHDAIAPSSPDDFRIMTPAGLDRVCPTASVLFDRDLAEVVPDPFFCLSPSSWGIVGHVAVSDPDRVLVRLAWRTGYLYVGSATDRDVVWCWDGDSQGWDDLSGGRWAGAGYHAWTRIMELARTEQIRRGGSP